MMKISIALALAVWSVSFLQRATAFQLHHITLQEWRQSRSATKYQFHPTSNSANSIGPLSAQTLKHANLVERPIPSVWEDAAQYFYPGDVTSNIQRNKEYTQLVTLFRVGVPAFCFAVTAHMVYPTIAMEVAGLIHDAGVFEVVSQDYSQYIQNILNTLGLMFSILVGQTYYFMYQQQEAIYLALFHEVTLAKSLLEQVALVSQGRQSLYEQLLDCVHEYVSTDLTKFNDKDPAYLLSTRPVDDPLEGILYLTSVGEPSIVYQTVRSLREARAARLGALQRKLPSTHMMLLWALAMGVLCIFPLLGAGSQTIGGLGILDVQAWYLGFIVFGIALTMGVVDELRQPGMMGAYNARSVLNVMVSGLKEELELRLNGMIPGPSEDMEPSVDSDGYYYQ